MRREDRVPPSHASPHATTTIRKKDELSEADQVPSATALMPELRGGLQLFRAPGFPVLLWTDLGGGKGWTDSVSFRDHRRL
jgi:hypothetical protein